MHLPLGLAFVVPALAVIFAVVLWFQFFRRARAKTLVPVDEIVVVHPRRPGSRAWVVVVALQAVLLAAGFLAMNTGEREEDRVERVVPEAALSRHEEYAEQFVWGAGITLGLAALVLVFRRPPAALALVSATAVASLIVAGLALRVGKAGGELVYSYNAGAAYATTSAPARVAADIPETSQTVTGTVRQRAPRPSEREEHERRR